MGDHTLLFESIQTGVTFASVGFFWWLLFRRGRRIEEAQKKERGKPNP